MSSQDEDADPTDWIKEEEDVFEEREVEQESQEAEAELEEAPVETSQRRDSTTNNRSEGAEGPVEVPQRRTSTRTKRPTKLFGIDFVNDEEEEESEASKRLEIPEDLKRKIVEKRINEYEDLETRESLWKRENQRRKEVEVKERKALISHCMKRTEEIEAESKKVWEQIKDEVKQMERSALEKDLKLPMEMSELEQIELEEVICNRKNYFYKHC